MLAVTANEHAQETCQLPDLVAEPIDACVVEHRDAERSRRRQRFVGLRRDDYDTILTVRPGITGLCQLAFAKESEILDCEDSVRDYVERLLPQKAALDVLYVRHRSLLMDLKILAWTVVAVIVRRDVAVDRGSGRR